MNTVLQYQGGFDGGGAKKGSVDFNGRHPITQFSSVEKDPHNVHSSRTLECV